MGVICVWVLFVIYRVVVVDKVTDFVLFISKMLCVSAVGVGSFFFFTGSISVFTDYIPTLNYFFTPVIVSIKHLLYLSK